MVEETGILRNCVTFPTLFEEQSAKQEEQEENWMLEMEQIGILMLLNGKAGLLGDRSMFWEK